MFEAMVQFGDFRVRLRERELVGPDGPVELTGRAFDLLVAFLDAPDTLLDKDALNLLLPAPPATSPDRMRR